MKRPHLSQCGDRLGRPGTATHFISQGVLMSKEEQFWRGDRHNSLLAPSRVRCTRALCSCVRVRVREPVHVRVRMHMYVWALLRVLCACAVLCVDAVTLPPAPPLQAWSVAPTPSFVSAMQTSTVSRFTRACPPPPFPNWQHPHRAANRTVATVNLFRLCVVCCVSVDLSFCELCL